MKEFFREKYVWFLSRPLYQKVLLVVGSVFVVLFFVFLFVSKFLFGGKVEAKSDVAHDEVVSDARELVKSLDEKFEKEQMEAQEKRKDLESEVMRPDDEKKKFEEDLDAAAATGSVDVVLSVRDKRRKNTIRI